MGSALFERDTREGEVFTQRRPYESIYSEETRGRLPSHGRRDPADMEAVWAQRERSSLDVYVRETAGGVARCES